MLDNGHVERAPSLDSQKERWYLPLFGVHHPQKPDQIRVVFDSSAEFEGVSLNNMLLRGPDLNNSLLGVLMRFRKEPVAFIADIRQMFYCFMVREDHRDYLRLLWFEDNDMTKEMTEYRMKVHVFGNRPSPSVAMYCMRRAAQQGEEKFGSDASLFVHRNFYVDDGLASVVTPQDAIELLTRTRKMLAESNLNLHKIASNSNEVINAFDVRDRAKGLANLDLSSDPLPLQRSLGAVWNLETDSFTFRVSSEIKNFSRRGVLSTINSLYDPLRFVAPVTLHGKVMMRELSSSNGDWDAPLDPDKEAEWIKWKRSLAVFENLAIPRCFAKAPLSLAQRKELFIFSDASTVAIGAVAYLRSIDKDGKCHVGFVMGKSKLAPKPAHTIPRLELCAAVLAVELSEVIINEMDIEVDAVMFFTDCKIVLGYVNNSVRRFYMYVANRVNRIRASSNPDQWHYISTEENPADLASRPTLAADLQNSSWFSGPKFLSDNKKLINEENKFDLINPDDDKEIRSVVATLHTNVIEAPMGSHRLERFSSWKRLCNAMARLIHVATSFKRIPGEPNKGSWKSLHQQCSVAELSQAKNVIIRCVQQDTFQEEMMCLKNKKPISQQSPLRKLNPFLDDDMVLRIGGRISSADLSRNEKHPVIIPRTHHLATVLCRHYHECVAHQGRHITEGAIRAAGYWVIGCKRLVSSIIYNCVICRKLRGKQEKQIMADLPADRRTQQPAFTSVGLDVFGPWNIITRRTRGVSPTKFICNMNVIDDQFGSKV